MRLIPLALIVALVAGCVSVKDITPATVGQLEEVLGSGNTTAILLNEAVQQVAPNTPVAFKTAIHADTLSDTVSPSIFDAIGAYGTEGVAGLAVMAISAYTASQKKKHKVAVAKAGEMHPEDYSKQEKDLG